MSEDNIEISRTKKLMIYIPIVAIIAIATLATFLLSDNIVFMGQILLVLILSGLIIVLIYFKLRYDKVSSSSTGHEDTMLVIDPYSISILLGALYALLQGLPTGPGDPGSLDLYALGITILNTLTGFGGLTGAIVLVIYGILYYAMPTLGVVTGTADSRILGGPDQAFAIRAYARQGIKDVAIGLIFIYGSLSIISWMAGLAFIS